MTGLEPVGQTGWLAWWRDQCNVEIEMLAPKISGYGSRDLIEIGRTMAQVTGRPEPDDTEATMLGIYFYAVGKIARWTEAVREGRPVSDDTLMDLSVYAHMALKTQQTGSWP